jgi:60 kDa SS-A/Ro ribonucleoprotein
MNKTTNKVKSTSFVKALLGQPEKVVTKTEYLSKNELPEDSVARVLLTGILKNQFYRSVDDAAKEALPLLIDRAKLDPEYLLKAACFARNSHMKGMVKVALAAIAGSANEQFLDSPVNKQAAIALLSTFHPGQLIQFVELCKSKQLGRGFGSRAQKWVRAAMEKWGYKKLENFTLKYPTALNQLVRLVHPRYTDGRANVILYVLDGRKAEATGSKQVAVEMMKKLSDPKKIADMMLENEIPWDVVKGFAGLKGPLAMASMTQMGLTALLLNIRSLEERNVFDTTDGLTALKLKMGEVQNGRSLPLDFAKPYIFAKHEKVKDILIDAMVATLDVPMPTIEGKRVGVSVDISGSMNGEPLQTAGLLAVPFLKATNLWFTTFDNALYEEGHGGRYGYASGMCPRITGLNRKNQVKNLLALRVAGGTTVSLAIENATNSKRKLDLMVLITDEQQNAGTPLTRAWAEYRKKVNPEAELWVINASNYQWHSADFGDRSVTVYQTMTPALFKNLEYVGINIVKAIRDFDLNEFVLQQQKPKAEEAAVTAVEESDSP